ncbi:BCCT family transporter, partial [Escherichia coli]|uniref:BCCT family transporter n=1 Tax=Escherichia coli TaxID=562 RepID=UPI0020347F51
MALGYFSYRYNLPLTIRSALYPIFGKRINGPIGHSVDIAAVIAQSDQKVLFIDADLRRGYSHNLFTVSNEHGLSEYLAGK